MNDPGMNPNAAFANGGDALAHLRQFGSMPLGQWFSRLLQTAPQAGAAQQQQAMGNAQQMTAQAPGMEASDPWLAQLAQQQTAQQGAEQGMPGDYNQAPPPPQMPPMMGEGDIGPGFTPGMPPPPSQQPQQAPSMMGAAPSSGQGPGNMRAGESAGGGIDRSPASLMSRGAGSVPTADTGFLKFFQSLFGGGAGMADAINRTSRDMRPSMPPGSGPETAPMSRNIEQEKKAKGGRRSRTNIWGAE